MTPRSLKPVVRTALFPGSFNPFTIGHKSIVDRATALFDTVIIAIGSNDSKYPADSAAVEERIEAIRRIYPDHPRVEVISYTGLTVDACRQYGARWILRGIRSVADFEYERNLADINRRISGIETMLLFSLPEYASISSSMVRELRHYGRDVSEFLPRPKEEILL